MVIDRRGEKGWLVGIDLLPEVCQISYIRKWRGTSGMKTRSFPRGADEAVPQLLRRCFLEMGEEISAEHTAAVCFTAAADPMAPADFMAPADSMVPAGPAAASAASGPVSGEELRKAAEEIFPPGIPVLFEGHGGAFYRYLMAQGEELRRKDVLLLDGWGEAPVIRRLKINRRTKPYLCVLEEETGVRDPAGQASDSGVRDAADQDSDRGERDASGKSSDRGATDDLDKALARSLMVILQRGDASAAYLTGPLFGGGRMRESLKVLTRGRKVFGGDNLYSLGALYRLLEEVGGMPGSTRYVFLGEDVLHSDIGIRCRQRFAETSLTLLHAGTPLREASAAREFIAQDTDVITITVLSAASGKTEDIAVHLDRFPKREEATVRIKVSLSMLDKDVLSVEVEDLGFGEIRPSSGMSWEMEIRL